MNTTNLLATAVPLDEAIFASSTHNSGVHVFSIADILGGFDGTTYADDDSILNVDAPSESELETPYIGFPPVPFLTDKDGNKLLPIDSEFGFEVIDFFEAIVKVRDNDYKEGWAGNIETDLDGDTIPDLVGLALINAKTDTFKSGQPLGTWAAGLGGNSVKASTEHYAVMAHLLSDQQFAASPDGSYGDPAADYPLDNNLIIISYLRDADGNLLFDAEGALIPGPLHDAAVADVVEQLQSALDGGSNSIEYESAFGFGSITITDNGDGIADIRDVLAPNETTLTENIAYSNDYSVTLKDDGKLLYRWGTEIKRPNDIRLQVQLDLPELWLSDADGDSNGIADIDELNGGLGYKVTKAELVITHNITNNPNDQVRPEDYENEAATGRKPSYYIVQDPDDPTNTLWVSPVDSYDGSGAFLPSYFKLTEAGDIDLTADGTPVLNPDGVLVGYRNTSADGELIGTVLRDYSLIAENEAAGLSFGSSDLAGGFTNAYYTSTDRDPFQWSYDEFAADPYRQVYRGFADPSAAAAAGFTDAELASGPRWRLTANKFGQDIPGVEIPLIDNSKPPFQQDNIRYPVGEFITTTLNLLDWEDENGNGVADDSPLLYSSGWTLIDPTRLDENSDGVIDEGWSQVNGSLQAGDLLPAIPIVSAVTPNGLNLTPEFFDTAVYLKGDRQDSAKIFTMQLNLDYEDPAAPLPEPVATTALAALETVVAASGQGESIGEGQSQKDVPTLDLDQPLNTAPDYRASHIFSTNDVTGLFDGTTQGDLLEADIPIIDFSAEPMFSKDGVALYPINSEFGFNVIDFAGAEAKDFFLDPDYEEGWAGDLVSGIGEQLGVIVSNAATATFNTPYLRGTWLVGMGGSSVKASTEHYSVMQQVLSDQYYPEDPEAVYPLDDNLIVIGGDFDGRSVADVIAELEAAGTDINGDGRYDIRDVLAPNENTVTENIAVSSDYSVTLKDDGKLLYRWGNLVKRPTDIRLRAEMPLPEAWSTTNPITGLLPLYRVSEAELVVRHTISNNPNDQIRPEDFENEAASGRSPSYAINSENQWVSTDAYFAGDGTYYEAGTVLRDPVVPINSQGTLLDQIGALSEDLEEGFTNAWYTTQDREPFEPVITDGMYEVGPRWRLKSNKYGQDLPGVEIPKDPSLPPPPTKDELKYEVGAETQTVLNLMDWEGISPFTLNVGWQNGADTVTENGLKLSENFDVAFYIKGDRKPITLYDAELVMSYDEVAIQDFGTTLIGTAADDVLAGLGGNTFTGDAGADLFVLAYGAEDVSDIITSTINDFEIGEDAIGLINLGVTTDNFAEQITQSLTAEGLQISLLGTPLTLLPGVETFLGIDDFYLANVEAETAYQGYFNFAQFARFQALDEGLNLPQPPAEINGIQLALMFDETYYLADNQDVANAVINGAFVTGFEHFLQFGLAEGRNPSILFDEAYYLANNQDVDEAVSNNFFSSGLSHYLLFGAAEGRDPSRVFDESDYLLTNPDVKAAVDDGFFTNGLDHYLEFGATEGRAPNLLLFQEMFYLATYADVAQAVDNGFFESGFDHYIIFGQGEQRDPSSLFDESAYLAANIDVATAVDDGWFSSGFEHYIKFGRAEGRETFMV